jgi:hypothetical protein
VPLRNFSLFFFLLIFFTSKLEAQHGVPRRNKVYFLIGHVGGLGPSFLNGIALGRRSLILSGLETEWVLEGNAEAIQGALQDPQTLMLIWAGHSFGEGGLVTKSGEIIPKAAFDLKRLGWKPWLVFLCCKPTELVVDHYGLRAWNAIVPQDRQIGDDTFTALEIGGIFSQNAEAVARQASLDHAKYAVSCAKEL